MKAVKLTVSLKIDNAESFSGGAIARIERNVTQRFNTRYEALEFLAKMNAEATQELENATKMYGELDALKDADNRIFGGTLKG
jgi:hypothetical protein